LCCDSMRCVAMRCVVLRRVVLSHECCTIYLVCTYS
jgi:hypothetical protein